MDAPLRDVELNPPGVWPDPMTGNQRMEWERGKWYFCGGDPQTVRCPTPATSVPWTSGTTIGRGEGHAPPLRSSSPRTTTLVSGERHQTNPHRPPSSTLRSPQGHNEPGEEKAWPERHAGSRVGSWNRKRAVVEELEKS